MNVAKDDIITEAQPPDEFEKLYIQLRLHEKRVYSDEEVMWLPEIGDDHIHKNEWDIRKHSCERLVRYLRNKERSLKILEVGCGNGWLSFQLSQIRYSNVIGLDINRQELLQAERVFTTIPNLSFIHGGLSAVEFEKFDIVVFAASIQYFNSFSDVVETALDLLNSNGEIHIIDSNFYSEEKLNEAALRTRQYYQSQGFESMNAFYFHHSLAELKGYNYHIKYDPNSILNKILRSNPFYWICIKK